MCDVCDSRSANLILNLFSLMLDAGVPDIALEPDKTVQKVLGGKEATDCGFKFHSWYIHMYYI